MPAHATGPAAGLVAAAAVAVALAAVAATGARADLDFSRVHLVDHNATTGSTLWRSNMPVNSTSGEFQYAELMGMFAKRAAAANVSFSESTYLIDVSLNNLLNKGYSTEVAFWKAANASLGRIELWPLGVAGLLPPSVYPAAQRDEMAVNGSVWAVDKIPSRVRQLHAWVHEPQPQGAVAVLVHCEAGCDRTGEVVFSYDTAYTLASQPAETTYKLMCEQCGRCPNYFSTSAQEWWCVRETVLGGGSGALGNCLDLATCKPFGSCVLKNGTEAAVPSEH